RPHPRSHPLPRRSPGAAESLAAHLMIARRGRPCHRDWQDQLDAVCDHLQQRWQHWNLLRLGPQHAEDGQAHIAAGLVRVLPEIAVWAASLPSGIVALEPWLTPLRGDRGTTS